MSGTYHDRSHLDRQRFAGAPLGPLLNFHVLVGVFLSPVVCRYHRLLLLRSARDFAHVVRNGGGRPLKTFGFTFSFDRSSGAAGHLSYRFVYYCTYIYGKEATYGLLQTCILHLPSKD